MMKTFVYISAVSALFAGSFSDAQSIKVHGFLGGDIYCPEAYKVSAERCLQNVAYDFQLSVNDADTVLDSTKPLPADIQSKICSAEKEFLKKQRRCLKVCEYALGLPVDAICACKAKGADVVQSVNSGTNCKVSCEDLYGFAVNLVTCPVSSSSGRMLRDLQTQTEKKCDPKLKAQCDRAANEQFRNLQDAARSAGKAEEVALRAAENEAVKQQKALDDLQREAAAQEKAVIQNSAIDQKEKERLIREINDRVRLEDARIKDVIAKIKKDAENARRAVKDKVEAKRVEAIQEFQRLRQQCNVVNQCQNAVELTRAICQCQKGFREAQGRVFDGRNLNCPAIFANAATSESGVRSGAQCSAIGIQNAGARRQLQEGAVSDPANVEESCRKCLETSSDALNSAIKSAATSSSAKKGDSCSSIATAQAKVFDCVKSCGGRQALEFEDNNQQCIDTFGSGDLSVLLNGKKDSCGVTCERLSQGSILSSSAATAASKNGNKEMTMIITFGFVSMLMMLLNH